MPRRKTTKRRINSPSINQIPFQELNNPFKPMELISADQVEYIHNASLKILSQIGIQVDSPVALKLLSSIGAKINRSTKNVKLDPALVNEMLEGIPTEFTIHARNPKKNSQGWRKLHDIRNRMWPFICFRLRQRAKSWFTGRYEEFCEVISIT